jgi:hypothetical protein
MGERDRAIHTAQMLAVIPKASPQRYATRDNPTHGAGQASPESEEPEDPPPPPQPPQPPPSVRIPHPCLPKGLLTGARKVVDTGEEGAGVTCGYVQGGSYSATDSAYHQSHRMIVAKGSASGSCRGILSECATGMRSGKASRSFAGPWGLEQAVAGSPPHSMYQCAVPR